MGNDDDQPEPPPERPPVEKVFKPLTESKKPPKTS